MSKLFSSESLKGLGKDDTCLLSEKSFEVIIFWTILLHVIPKVTQVEDQLHEFLVRKCCRLNRSQQLIKSAFNVQPGTRRHLLLLLGMQEEHSAQEERHLR